MTARRTGIMLGIALAAAASVAFVAATMTRRDPASRLHSAAARGDWAAISAEELAATPAGYADLATALGRAGRPALARLVLEAAGRVAPDDPAVRKAMRSVEGGSGERAATAHVVDQLGAVPGGDSLATLALGLAELARTDAADDPMVDRVLARDRATLGALDSPTAVRRLLARVLLELGRPAEARGRIAAILAEGADPEASWLLSRACLQMGEDDAAEAALARAGDFARDRPHEAEPAAYVGARACRECHSEIFDAQQNSRHATTVTLGADLAKIPLPEGVVTDPADPGVSHSFAREGDKVRVRTRTKDASYQALMDYALGSGHRGMTLVGKDDQGTYREARISLYSERGTTWDVTSGFSPHPADPSEFLGKALSPSGFRECVHCHVTRFRSIDDRSGPEAADRGIGCERCHGPGGNHVLAMKNGFADLAIGRYTKATGAQRMTACAGCHASDGTFPPTDPQFVRFQSTTLPFSRCFTESRGKLDCVTCHDPHKPVETSPAFYEAKCLSCHGGSSGKEEGFRRVACPVNPSKDCLSCHMPRVEEVAPHTSFTDHHIRVRKPGGGNSP